MNAKLIYEAQDLAQVNGPSMRYFQTILATDPGRWRASLHLDTDCPWLSRGKLELWTQVGWAEVLTQVGTECAPVAEYAVATPDYRLVLERDARLLGLARAWAHNLVEHVGLAIL
jgi:hypothetical protein